MTSMEFGGEREVQPSRPSFVELALSLAERIAVDASSIHTDGPEEGISRTLLQEKILLQERLRYMKDLGSTLGAMCGDSYDIEATVELISAELKRLNELISKACDSPDFPHNPELLLAIEIDLISLLDDYSASRQ